MVIGGIFSRLLASYIGCTNPACFGLALGSVAKA